MEKTNNDKEWKVVKLASIDDYNNSTGFRHYIRLCR